MTLRSLWVLIFLAINLLGCTSAPQTQALLTREQTSFKPKIEIPDIPFFPQEKYQCGPAALASMMGYRGISITPEQLEGRIFLPGRQGSLQLEILSASRSKGLLPYPIAPRLEALLQELTAGNPVLVLQNLGLDWYPRWHYAVAIGFDLKSQAIILHSGITKNLYRPLPLFEHTWAKGDYWGLVLMPAGQLPATVQRAPYLKAVSQLEQVDQLDAAYQGYRRASRQWPDHPLPWIGLGNSSYKKGMFQQATESFRKALAINPNGHQTWNNLAYALTAEGCQREGLLALDCALRLSPASPSYLSSRAQLQQEETANTSDNCRLPACPHSGAGQD
jgi:tetratricopeptide (TPR) repeat protein